MIPFCNGRDTQKTQHGIETLGICEVVKDDDDVETLRKPSTGLKHGRNRPIGHRLVETLRKPSTGLKPADDSRADCDRDSRDTQKTQHGIETTEYDSALGCFWSRDTQKTQHGIETSTVTVSALCSQCRDTQKTQHGIETQSGSTLQLKQRLSRHSENPARD